MSVRREFVWTCDLCEDEERNGSYGMPYRWRCFFDRKQEKLVHACTECDPPEHWIEDRSVPQG